jgi:nitroreductase
MNETLKNIAGRYSCRDFAATPLTSEQVNNLAEAALASPSGMNRQPWHVIVITDKALIDEVDAVGVDILANAEDKGGYEMIKSRGGKLFYNAPCMVVIVSDGSGSATMDCGIVSQNVVLAATSMGLGSCICGMARIPISGPKGEELTKRMKFPEGYGFGIAVLVGHANSGKAPHELDKSKLTFLP